MSSKAGFESVASRLSAADTSLIHVYTQLYDEDAMTDLRRMVAAGADAVDEDIDALPPDADEATRQSLAEKLAPTLAQHLTDYPWLSDPAAHLSKSEHITQQTFIDAVVGLYNTAQLDVLGRAASSPTNNYASPAPRTTIAVDPVLGTRSSLGKSHLALEEPAMDSIDTLARNVENPRGPGARRRPAPDRHARRRDAPSSRAKGHR